MQGRLKMDGDSSLFAAIGVNQGDAFFLRKGCFSVLVDGGRSIQGFPEQFRRVIRQDGIDVLVCTHNDADHANGVLGFLRSGLKCKEVWLPGSWTYRLHDLLRNPRVFIDELAKDVDGMKEHVPHSLEKYSERLSTENEEHGKGEGFDLAQAIEEAREISVDHMDLFYMFLERNFLNFLLGMDIFTEEGKKRLFLDAVFAAERIREISITSYHSGAQIRWFEYRKNSPGGGGEFLKPLNAREMLPATARWRALQYLALTTANKESLVFISPQNGDGPAVLFTADSDLSFTQPAQWSDGMIITAPHHGAESSANAYRLFGSRENHAHAIWVRSDGRFRNRPGKSYLAVPGDRYCTLCRGGNTRQDVLLSAELQKWRPVNEKIRICHCDD